MKFDGVNRKVELDFQKNFFTKMKKTRLKKQIEYIEKWNQIFQVKIFMIKK